VSGSYAASDGQLADGQTLTNWTVELWVKPAAANRHQGIFNNHGVPWKGLEMAVTAQGGFGFLVIWPNTYYDVVSPNGIITTNQWQLLAAVGEGNQQRLFRNGVLVGSVPSPGQASFFGTYSGDVLGHFVFGLNDYATLPDANFYEGLIADFRVWDRALSAQELLSHTIASPATNAIGLRNWIPFGETAGNRFLDILSGMTGTYYSMDLVSDWPISCLPHAATATATLDHGFVVDATITDGGCGYTNAPAVLIRGGGGIGATATAVVSNGVVVGITITDAGIGYTSPPEYLHLFTHWRASRSVESCPAVLLKSIAGHQLPVAGFRRHERMDKLRCPVPGNQHQHGVPSILVC
jgi:hypothetical protein